jgi:hypothetical protein
MKKFLFYAHPKRLHRSIEAQVPHKALRDLVNSLRFNDYLPSDSPIFVPARDVRYSLKRRPGKVMYRRRHSGAVIGGDWDLSRREITTNDKFESCRMRYFDGAEWPETPIYKRLLQEIAEGKAPDECRSAADLDARYAALDKVFEETRARGRLLCKSEMPDQFRREHGGILLHIARDGTCLRSGGGVHRFAIARLLDLQEMPAQVGVIHPDAIRDGHVARLRKSSFYPG